jgi:uncharacterized protein (DUF2252 family)
MNAGGGEGELVAKQQEHPPVVAEDGNGRPRSRSRTGRGRSAAPTVIPHLTPSERAARGKAARAEVPRSSHAGFTPSTHRPDPVALLEEQATSRVPELVPIRYGRMLVSPFAFYRGAALIMAADLASTPSSGLRAQICGDAHLSNFGVFGSPERRMIFSVNDFDETLPGPWEWDVKRLAASLAVAGRDNGFTAAERRKFLLAGARAYRTGIARFAGMPNMAVWYAHLDVEVLLEQLRPQLEAKRVKTVESSLAKARTRDSVQAFAKFATEVDGEPRIVSDPPLIVPIEELLPDDDRREVMAELAMLLRTYRKTLESDKRHLLEQFRFVHLARKVVGVGSVGTRAWIGLLLGRDGQDPLFLQMKEAQESVLARFAGRSKYANQGQRVVAGQRLMQTASDIFLGWQRVTGIDGEQRDFYIRQLRDWKGSAEIERMNPKGMAIYARMCAWTLARAHARSGDRVAIASYLGKSDVFDNAIADFAETYADQNERDYQVLADAVSSGRIKARTGV